MARRLVVGNWKMRGTRSDLAELLSIDAASADIDTVVCPPFPLISAARAAVSNIAIGAQDCHWASQGAHTGAVSAAMIADAGAEWVIVGHSEIRTAAKLSNADVGSRVAAAQRKLRPILCVGEATRGDDLSRVADQLLASIPPGADPNRLTIAYEPNWAIGVGATPSTDEIARAHILLRDGLLARFGEAGRKIRILYGGSVQPDNAGMISAIPQVEGLLVGGASIRAATFVPIIEAVAKPNQAATCLATDTEAAT